VESPKRFRTFENAQDHPSQLVAGLFIGISSTILALGWLWFFLG
jgi:hypothetical protein